MDKLTLMIKLSITVLQEQMLFWYVLLLLY